MAKIKGVWEFNDSISLFLDDGALVGETVNFDANGEVFHYIGSGDCPLDYVRNPSGDGVQTPEYVHIHDGNNWIAPKSYRTIDFGKTEQEVSDDFYAWITANATQRIDAYVIRTETLENIGNAIREKLNTTDKYTPTEMPQAIRDISGGGGDGGSYDQGYADGQTAEYDRFWDAYQNEGKLTNYYQTFIQPRWNAETFKPKYPITMEGKKDSSNASGVFYNSRIVEIAQPIIVTGPGNGDTFAMRETFLNASSLETISYLELNEVTSFHKTFNGCTSLKNLTVGGSIDVNFSISETDVLSDASITSIVDHLKQFDTASQTLTVHSTVRGKMNEIFVEPVEDGTGKMTIPKDPNNPETYVFSTATVEDKDNNIYSLASFVTEIRQWYLSPAN